MDKFLGKYRIPSARHQKWDYGWNAPYFVTICTAKRKHYFGEIINGEMHFSEIGELANNFWHEIPKHFPFVILDAFQVMPNHIHGLLIIDKTGDWQNENAEIKMDGSADGSADGSTNGSANGSADGSTNGSTDGSTGGSADGSADGSTDGSADGSADGSTDGSMDGSADGSATLETRQCLVSPIQPDHPAYPDHPNYAGYTNQSVRSDNFDNYLNPNDSGNPDQSEQIKINLTPGQLRYQNQGKETLSSIIGSYKSVVTKYAHKINNRFGWQSRFHDHIIRDNASHQRIGNYIINNPKNWKEDKFFE